MIEQLKRREATAWAALFEEHHPLVYRVVLAQVGDRAVAEDIAGQVFLEALEGIDRYRDRGKPISAWLLTIARHRSLDWLRKRGREQTGEIPDAPDDPVPDDGDEAISALSLLTPEQREVVVLRFVEDYALHEVAELTGRSTGAVKAMQHRALRQLRSILQRHEEGDAS